MEPRRPGPTGQRAVAPAWRAQLGSAVLLLFAAALGACGRSDDPGQRRAQDVVPADTGGSARVVPHGRAAAAPPAEDSVTGSPRVASRPARRTDTLRVEGSPQPLESRLYRPPWREPLAFSTYVPADMITDAAGDTVRFVADFGGERNDSAFMEVVRLPHGVAPDSIRRATRRLAEQHGLRAGPTSARLPWAIAEFDFRGAGCSAATCPTGTVVLAAHGGRFFRMLWRYPAEYGDGMAPRIRWILEEWRWQDTGDGLEP